MASYCLQNRPGCSHTSTHSTPTFSSALSSYSPIFRSPLLQATGQSSPRNPTHRAHLQASLTLFSLQEQPHSPSLLLVSNSASSKSLACSISQMGSFSLETSQSFGSISQRSQHSPWCHGNLHKWLLTLEDCELVGFLLLLLLFLLAFFKI